MIARTDEPRFKMLSLDEMRDVAKRINQQTVYLRTHQDNGRKSRFVLMSEIAANLGLLSGACNLPGGYTDPNDPFACDALGIFRSEFEELRKGDYPVTDDCELLPNGKRL